MPPGAVSRGPYFFQYPVPAARDHVEMRCVVLSAQPSLPCHVSAPARALVARLLTPEPRHRLNSLLKLTREAWFASYDLDAVKAKEVGGEVPVRMGIVSGCFFMRFCLRICSFVSYLLA